MATIVEDAVSVRFIEQADLDRAVEVEAAVHRYTDPDFQVQCLPPYTWSRADFVEVIRQYRSKSKATNDTRVMVAEVIEERTADDGTVARVPRVVGSLCFEKADGQFQVLLMSAPNDTVRMAFLRHMVGRMGRSDEHKKLVVTVPDGDWPLLKFLMKNQLTGDSKQGGFSVRLVPDFTVTGFDVWRAEYSLPAQDPRPAPAPTNT